MNYEVEVKVLLGEKKNADALLQQISNSAQLVQESTQLNHYFIDGDTKKLYEALAPYYNEVLRSYLKQIFTIGKNFSIRSRQINDQIRFIVKATLDMDSSANGVRRAEFDEAISLSLEELDKLVLSCGFSYQSKWSRSRQEYSYNDFSICLDKNAGYGYLAEFEKVVLSESETEKAKQDILTLLSTFGLEELSQDRLERMFTFYNDHWPEYYGTEKTFVVK